jgi:glycosyltransferase involved in cell wall biosynthesis
MASVSVIVPAYNCGEFIGEAIESILGQTRVPDEIIVVNDGSTDDTARVISRYRHSGLRYVEQRNSGIAATRNRGLSLARGDYIGFLDGDDRWRPTMLEKQLNVLEGDRTLVCSFTNFLRFEDVSGRALCEQFQCYPELSALATSAGPIPNSRVLTGDAFCDLVGFFDIPAFTQVMLFRRSSIAGLVFPEKLFLGEDTEFALRTFMKGRVAFNVELLADVRRHESNTTKDHDWMPVYKLAALKSIEDAVGNGARRVAYLDRLVRAHVDAAIVHCKRGQYRAGLSVYFEGLSLEGSLGRKIKGAVRIAGGALRSVLIGVEGRRRSTRMRSHTVVASQRVVPIVRGGAGDSRHL